MLEALILGLFLAGLFTCLLADISILIALLFGWALFCCYGLIKKHPPAELLRFSLKGMVSIHEMLTVFLLIGILTAVWRAAGTIPFIIVSALPLMPPHLFILAAFLLCALMSLLMGTSFGAAATVGVICATMGGVLEVDMLWLGGAVLGGCYFGDRCSPMSTSALLVSHLTGTNIYHNIRLMIRSSLLPLALTCLIYLLMGWQGGGGARPDLTAAFALDFKLHWLTLLPAAVVVILSALRVQVRLTMVLSIVCGAVLCLTVQAMPPGEVLRLCWSGYVSAVPELGGMMDGGGIISMLEVAAIVCLSASYSGLFDGTGLLDKLKKLEAGMAARLMPFGATVITSALASMMACNQTLAIMLTDQMCRDLEAHANNRAIYLEDSVVVMSPLVPWSIAGAVPLAMIGAPIASMAAASYLYLLPLCSWLLFKRRKPC